MVAEANASQKKRGDRGKLGKGTAGRNVKRRHRRDMKHTKQKLSLREYAKRLASEKPSSTLSPEGLRMFNEDVEFSKTWMERKGLS